MRNLHVSYIRRSNVARARAESHAVEARFETCPGRSLGALPAIVATCDSVAAPRSRLPLEQALAWARRAPATHASVVDRAFEEGLLSEAPRAPIRWPDDLPDRDTSDEQKRRAALIAGHLSRDRLRDGAALSERMLLASIAYVGALATPPGQHALADLNLQGFLKAHVYTCLRSERHGHIIEEAEEKALFGWLLAQAELGLGRPAEENALSAPAAAGAHRGYLASATAARTTSGGSSPMIR
jgi:hypothetical protein